MDYKPTQHIEQTLDSASSVTLESQADFSLVVKKTLVPGSLQKELTRTYPINVDKDFSMAPSLSGDSMPQTGSRREGLHIQSQIESPIRSDIRSGSSGTIDPSALLAPPSPANNTGHTITDQSPQQSAVISKPNSPDSSHLASKRSLLPLAAISSSTGPREEVRRKDTVSPSNSSSGSIRVSEAIFRGRKRGSEYIMNPTHASVADIAFPFGAANLDANSQDNQSKHTHQGKKSRTQGPDSEPAANAATAANATNHPSTQQPDANAGLEAYLADYNQQQRQQPYANRDRMLQMMIDSGIPAIVAAAQRNKNNPIDPDLHPAYCGIKLRDAEAHEMETKMLWSPLNMSLMSAS